MNLIEELMEESPASQLGIVAVDAGGNRRDWHFGELIAKSAGLSGAFAARGVRRGDVVMTLAGNRIEWVLTLLACWRMGAVALPCSTMLRRHDLEHRVAAANPKLCVGEEELLAELPDGVPMMTMADVARVLDEDQPQETPAAIEEMGPEDPALIVFTSGTTGEPRGVVHGYRYLMGQRLQAEHWFGSRKDDLAWCTTATGWSKSARNVFLAPWITGAAAVIHDGRFDPAERLDIAEALGVNVLCQAPTEYRMLARRTALRPLPALRRMVSAGEPLDPETIAAFREATGLEPADGYGQTETGQVTANLVGEPVRLGSMGKPLPGIETRIIDGEFQLRAASSPPFSPATSMASASKASGGKPATWSMPTRTATSSSRAAATTSSSPPAIASAPPRLSQHCSPTRRWPTPLQSPPLILSAAPSSARSSSSVKAKWATSSSSVNYRSTANRRPLPTSFLAWSNSPMNCPRPTAERSNERSYVAVDGGWPASPHHGA